MITQAADPPAAPSLPQEIIDIITTHLRSDKGTLSVLSLVSWSWLHSSRRHIFARVILGRELYRCPVMRGRADPTLDPFGLEIMTRSPAIASCIRFVQIRADQNQDHVTKGFQFLSLLPNLRSLTLVDISWPGIQPENVPTILRGIATVAPALEELSLTEVTFVTTADLAAFIRAFPKVKRVSFAFCKCETHRLDPPALTPHVFRGLPEPPVQSLICLEHVGIQNSASQAILELLLQQDAFKLDLMSANIHWKTPRECLANFSMYKKFFDVVGNTLQTFALRVRVLDHQQPDAIIQLFSKCRRLSSFSIDIWCGQYSVLLVWFQSILETVTASSVLKEFTIHCSLHSDIERNRYTIPWEKVDDMLALLPVFRKLKVVIHCIGLDRGPSVDPRIRNAVHKSLRESMHRLQQAGMLEIWEPME